MSQLRKLFHGKSHGEIREASDKIGKLLKSGKIDCLKPDPDLHLRDIAESTLGDEAMRTLGDVGGEGFHAIQESVDPVNLTAFSNITGQLILQGVMEQYKSPEFISDQMMTQETSREDNTRVPGLQPISDDTLEVKEGEEYPDVKYGEDYIDIPKSLKRGQKIGITKEMIFFDRTGMAIEMARGVGNRMGTNKEIRCLRVILGIDNNFVRKGTARDTYVTVAEDATDPRINQLAATELLDWTSIDAAMQLYNLMQDDRTVAEPIQVAPDTLLVTQYKWATASRILSASEIRNTQGANITISGNPISPLGLKLLTSPWIQWVLVNKGGLTAANAKQYWHLGQPKKAFVYRTLFPLEVRAANHDKDDFERDVVAQFRASERGVAYVKAPWYNMQVYLG